MENLILLLSSEYACSMRRLDCIYPRPSFSPRDACYAGYVEAGDMRKESAQGIIESLRLLLTHENGDFGAAFVKERGCASPILKVGCHISDRFLCHSRVVNRCSCIYTG